MLVRVAVISNGIGQVQRLKYLSGFKRGIEQGGITAPRPQHREDCYRIPVHAARGPKDIRVSRASTA